MAGAGYKLFATGDVLTAAQVNTYLMQQTVMVFASSAARTSALSGVLAEGMVSYLQDTNTLEVYDGAAWVGATGDITGLTAGTGISISSATGPVPTVAIDTAVTADLTTAQTLTNKTLTSPVLTTPSISNIEAKGDILVGTADNTLGVITAGSNGDTLVADSSTSTGLRYQGSIAGGKNFCINGGMDIWQRGTTFTATGVGYNAYTVDRWTCYTGGTGTFTQDTSLSASGFRYGTKFTSTAASNLTSLFQMVETDQTIPLAGKQVALSGYALAPAGKTPVMQLEYSTTVNDFLFGTWLPCTKTTLSEPTATGSLLQYRYSFAVPSTAKTLRITATYGTLNNTEAATWTGIQLELGNVPTAFSRAGGTIQGELAACQRYYWRVGGNSAYEVYANGFFWEASGSRSFGAVEMPVVMRTNPTVLDFNLLAFYDGTTITAGSAFAIIQNGTKEVALVSTTASALTSFRPYCLLANNTASSYLGFGAEL